MFNKIYNFLKSQKRFKSHSIKFSNCSKNPIEKRNEGIENLLDFILSDDKQKKE